MVETNFASRVFEGCWPVVRDLTRFGYVKRSPKYLAGFIICKNYKFARLVLMPVIEGTTQGQISALEESNVQ